MHQYLHPLVRKYFMLASGLKLFNVKRQTQGIAPRIKSRFANDILGGLFRAIDWQDRHTVNTILTKHKEAIGDINSTAYPCSEHEDDIYQVLHWAALRGELKIVQLLVEHGASINAPSGKKGVTPQQIAKLAGHKAIAKYLARCQAERSGTGVTAASASTPSPSVPVLSSFASMSAAMGEATVSPAGESSPWAHVTDTECGLSSVHASMGSTDSTAAPLSAQPSASLNQETLFKAVSDNDLSISRKIKEYIRIGQVHRSVDALKNPAGNTAFLYVNSLAMAKILVSVGKADFQFRSATGETLLDKLKRDKKSDPALVSYLQERTDQEAKTAERKARPSLPATAPATSKQLIVAAALPRPAATDNSPSREESLVPVLAEMKAVVPTDKNVAASVASVDVSCDEVSIPKAKKGRSKRKRAARQAKLDKKAEKREQQAQQRLLRLAVKQASSVAVEDDSRTDADDEEQKGDAPKAVVESFPATTFQPVLSTDSTPSESKNMLAPTEPIVSLAASQPSGVGDSKFMSGAAVAVGSVGLLSRRFPPLHVANALVSDIEGAVGHLLVNMHLLAEVALPPVLQQRVDTAFAFMAHAMTSRTVVATLPTPGDSPSP